MKQDTRRNIRLIVFVAFVSIFALILAAFTRRAASNRLPRVKSGVEVVIPSVPKIPPPPVLPNAQIASTTSNFILSPEFSSADGITQMVLRIPLTDTFTSGVWNTTKLSEVNVYGTSTAFESTLNWSVEDVNGRQLASGYTTIASPDIGIPGPFAIDARIMRLPSTRKGVLRVFEASAKDGSPLHEVKVPIYFICDNTSCAREVVLFFQNELTNPSPMDCSKVFSVTRKVFSQMTIDLEQVLSELVSGPTDFEMSKGYRTRIPKEWSVQDLNKVKEMSAACTIEAIQAQVQKTTQAFTK